MTQLRVLICHREDLRFIVCGVLWQIYCKQTKESYWPAIVFANKWMAGPAPTVELTHQVQRTDEKRKTIVVVGGKHLILSLTEQRGPTRSMWWCHLHQPTENISTQLSFFSQTPRGAPGKIPKLHLWSKSLVAQSKVLDPSLFVIQRPQDVFELSVSSSNLCLCKEKRFFIVFAKRSLPGGLWGKGLSWEEHPAGELPPRN